MRFHLFIALAICYSGLFANNAVAQATDGGAVPAWMLASVPKDRKAAYELYLKHHAGHAAKTAGTAERLIAMYNGQYNSSGTLAQEDSADYRYSGTRGMNPKPSQMYIANMRVDMLFDTGRNYKRGPGQTNYSPELRAVKGFNTSNLPDSMVFEDWTGSTWVAQQKAHYSYNTAGKESQVIWEAWDPFNLVWYNSYQNGYSYNAAGDIVADSMQGWDNSAKAWVNSNLIQYAYDGAGRLTTMLQQNWNATSNSWVPRSKDSIGYTATGKVASWTSQIFYAASGVWKNDYRSLSYYNSADFERAAVTQTDNTGAGWKSMDSTVHAVLNAAGLPLTDSIYADGGTGWYLSQRYTKTYTSSNQVVSSFWDQMNGSSFTNYYREFFFYDSYDQLTRHYDQTWNGISWNTAYTSEQRFYYEPYTTTGIQSAKARNSLQALLYPMPATTSTTLAINLPSAQQLKIALYDATGRLLQSWQEQALAGRYSKHISVANLPAGTYNLSVESRQGIWRGSLSVVR
jgi:hypothetical protein